MSLYNKHRPIDFDSIIGNQESVTYLNKVVEDEDRPHVYLFHGPTGCGKTTMARIMAAQLGAEGPNFNEINTADFRGIDTVRELIRTSRYQSIGGGSRVWLIDEVHKMTADAQNALLKLLEDPPSHGYYILCTTDPDKLLKTVRGRCIQIQVKPLQDAQMFQLLRSVAKAEGQKPKKSVYDQIIQDSFGHPRNALQILEKVLSVDEDQQLEMAKESATQYSESIDLCRALLSGAPWKKVRGLLTGLKDQEAEGIRRHVLGYAQSILLKSENDKAAQIIEEFYEPLYNIGFPGLVYCCYSVIKG